MRSDPTIEGICGAFWLLGLWTCAAMLDRSSDRPRTSTLRDAIVLGVLITGVLATLGALYAWSAWCAMFGVLVYAIWRRGSLAHLAFATRTTLTPGGLVVAIVTFCVAWPALVRPLLQGDSLGYHLPNAAAWSVSHSLWQTGTRYWWYPGGSELFASGLFTIAGPATIGLAGFVAVLLLGLRVRAFAVAAGWHDVPAGIVAAAVVAVPTIALAAVSLENDVWLAAFCVDALWCRRFEKRGLVRSLAMTALIKPYGIVFAAIALLVHRVDVRTAARVMVPIALWFARDAILMRGALMPPARNASSGLATTIVGNGALGFSTLAHAVATAGPGFDALALAWLATMLISRDLPLRLCAVAFALFFICEPFGFRNDIQQLATGASLRYALPALAIGAVGVLAPLQRVWIAGTAIALVLTVAGVAAVASVFANDATTHGLGVVAAIAIGALVLDMRLPRSHATMLAALGLVAYAARLGGTHPLDYLNDRLTGRPGGTVAFTWLAARAPNRIVGEGFPVGLVSLASPHTLAYDSDADDACRLARESHALLVANRPDGACGHVVFRDAYVTIDDVTQ